MILLKRFLLLFLVSLSSYICYATDEETSSSSSNASVKRTSRDFAVDKALEPPAKQVFARATYDSTIKHLLVDDTVRLDFIKTLSGLDGIETTTRLDGHIHPLHRFSELRTVVNAPNLKDFFNTVKKIPDSFCVKKTQKNKEEVVNKAGTQFIRDLSKFAGDLSKVIPDDRASQLDILCQLSDGRHVVVEVQVSKQDHWDARALSYISSVYSRQLSDGDDWGKLRGVIGINILGGGPQEIAYWKKSAGGEKNRSIRHYIMQDQLDERNKIDMLQLIQYSLADVDLDDPEFESKKHLKDWLDYFKNAHTRLSTPGDIGEVLEKAYDLIRFDKLPNDVKIAYADQDQTFKNHSEYTALVRSEGIAEGLELGKAEGIVEGLELGKIEGEKKAVREMALAMIAKKLDDEIILLCANGKLSTEELNVLKEENSSVE